MLGSPIQPTSSYSRARTPSTFSTLAGCCHIQNARHTCSASAAWQRRPPGVTSSNKPSRATAPLSAATYPRMAGPQQQGRLGPLPLTWGVVEVDSADLLFEIGTEELPSWYVEQGSTALVELLSQRLAAAGFAPEAAVAYGTPRRLSVIARGVPLHSPERVEERRGPGAGVAFAADGTPTRAAEAFAKSSGVPVTELEVRENDKGASYVYAKIKRGGEEAAAVLPGLLASVVTDLPAQRKMRWASEPVAFVRPVSWLLALLGDRLLNLDAAG